MAHFLRSFVALDFSRHSLFSRSFFFSNGSVIVYYLHDVARLQSKMAVFPVFPFTEPLSVNHRHRTIAFMNLILRAMEAVLEKEANDGSGMNIGQKRCDKDIIF